MRHTSPYTLRAYQAGDETALLELHNLAFDGVAPRSMEHWRWRFLQNPIGEPEITLAVDGEGRCMAVYAAISHHVVLKGERGLAGLQTDAAVAPGRRGGLAGSRVFLALGQLFRERFVTPKTRIEWGFPEPALQRMSLRHLSIGVLRDVIFLMRDLPTGILPERTLDVLPASRFDGESDELWERMRPDLAAATIRDSSYLNWRYCDHPDVQYGILQARAPNGGRLRGMAVYREGGWDPQLLSIMDWVVPFDDCEAEVALVHALIEEAVRRKKTYLAAWSPAPAPQFHRFQREYGFFAKLTPFQESYRSWAKGIDRRWLSDNWYQTMGDIDFF